ncbi:MAG: hypothetical protein J6L81_10680 [Clostridia bacterium]|nr:hypothetical protein [Clostridia bacterium]
MNRLKSQIKLYIPFAALALWMLMLHLSLDVGFNDDAAYAQALAQYNGNIFEYLKYRYFNINSRQIIDGAILCIIRHPTLWKLCDTAAAVLVSWCIAELLPGKRSAAKNWFVVLLVFLYPFDQMRSAGWIATTMNYLWVLAFGLFSLLVLKDIVRGKKPNIILSILSIPAILYAANQEQMCAVLLAVLGVFAVWLWIRDRRIYPIIAAHLSIVLLSIVHILTCPGGISRRAYETRWFPDFDKMSVFRKAELGFSSSLYEFVMGKSLSMSTQLGSADIINFIFAAFCILLAVSVYKNNRNMWVRAASLVPVVCTAVFGVFGTYIGTYVGWVSDVREAMTAYGTGISFSSIKSFVPDLILGLVCVGVCVSLWFAFKDKLWSLFMIFIAGLGLGTRILMGFSPTIWASQSRTFIFMYFAIIFCTAVMFAKLADGKDESNELCNADSGVQAG